MGSNTNFKNFGDTPSGPGNLGLARQSSVYSLTFDEFQNTMGGIGKDFGSMNMDELLKSIWSAEETQILASNAGFGTGLSTVPGGNLQRQGSITLPRTLSQKTVDEVWRDLVKETDGTKEIINNTNVATATNLPQRQQTLGEMTLEEFLVRAGIVREDAAQTQQIIRPNNAANNGNTNNSVFGSPQPVQSKGLYSNGMTQTNHSALNHPSILPLSFNGARSSQQQVHHHHHQQQQQQQQQQPLNQQVFPKPTQAVGFASPMHLVNNSQLTNSATKQANQSMMGLSQPAVSPASFVQSRGILPSGGVANAGGLRNCGVTVAAVSPASHLSPDMMVKSSIDSPSSLSPVPYMFNRRGKCSAALEKVIERRQKRMIKNRESAARSRARKQAYTMELEAEVAKLKERNEELQKKQEEILEMQKSQILETINQQWATKRPCLKRTFTGPW